MTGIARVVASGHRHRIGVQRLLSVLGALLLAALPAAPAEPEESPASATLSKEESAAFAATCKTLAQSFLKNDVEAFRKLCIPEDLLQEVVTPKLRERGIGELHKKILEGNTKRFAEFRDRFKDLTGFEFSSTSIGCRLDRSDAYADPRLVLKNSCFTIAYANRMTVRIEIEELVFMRGKYYLMKLD